MTATDLASLIATRKGKRSYERLAQDCGGVMSGARLQQLANGPLAHFSEPKVIEGLARGLDVTVTTVVAAMAASVGLDVRYGEDPTALVIGNAGNLPESARETVIGVARELLAAYQVTNLEGDHSDDPPNTDAGATPANVVPLHPWMSDPDGSVEDLPDSSDAVAADDNPDRQRMAEEGEETP